MKITDHYDPSLRKLKESSSSAKAKAERSRGESLDGQVKGDSVNLSSRSKEFAKARTEVDRTAEIRAEKVEALRAKVLAGEYKVDSDKVAEKMVDEHLSELL